MTEPARAQGGEALPQDQTSVAGEVLALHGGDALVAIEALVAEIEHLHRQAALAAAASSYGFTRGWRPSLERRPA